MFLCAMLAEPAGVTEPAVAKPCLFTTSNIYFIAAAICFMKMVHFFKFYVLPSFLLVDFNVLQIIIFVSFYNLLTQLFRKRAYSTDFQNISRLATKALFYIF